MALIVQKLENVVNILDDTRAAGEQIINSLSTDCVAQVQYKDPLPDQIDIWDADEWLYIYSFLRHFLALIQYLSSPQACKLFFLTL